MPMHRGSIQRTEILIFIILNYETDGIPPAVVKIVVEADLVE